MREYLKHFDVDYKDIAQYIPDVMNALHNDKLLAVVDLVEIRSAFRVKMMQSKAWLLRNFLNQNPDRNKSILVIGGWLGFTSWTLFKSGYNNITEIDIDPRLHNFATHLNRFNTSFVHYAMDANSIDIEKYDIIINTSAEHILDNTWFERIRPGAMLLVQSNNIDVPDHTNKTNSLEEMIAKYPLDLLYAGELDYNDGTSRFMLVGLKGDK